MKICDLLMRGGENAVPMEYLVAVTGRPSRDVRREIHNLRVSGVPVLADQRGFFLPSLDQTQAETEIDGFKKKTQSAAFALLDVVFAFAGQGEELEW